MTMVTDFLIGFLLLLSAIINILALSAFLITPSLRTTSNRFVINLLVVNVIGCIVLAPSLLFNSNVIRSLYVEEDSINIIDSAADANTILPTATATTIHSPTTSSTTSRLHTFYYYNNRSLVNRTSDNTNGADDSDVKEEEDEVNVDETGVRALWYDIEKTPFHRMRPWILDVIAAIGALSLLLVVGDTYIGVTDPLRYHSKISATRVCLLIVLVWCCALGFGVTSAFRSNSNYSRANGTRGLKIDERSSGISRRSSTGGQVYTTTFRSVYFVCIILIPFSLVCTMYCGIIRAARKNGIRLRAQNGSSPLLQSALHIGPSNHNEREHPVQDHSHPTQCCPRQSINRSEPIEGRLPKNRSAQFLTEPIATTATKCNCNDFLFITRSISSQSSYSSNVSPGRKAHKINLRTARSSPDLQQQFLLGESLSGSDANGGRLLHHHHHHQDHIRFSRRSTKTLGYMSSIRHRLSNASSMFKYREESRAARISILVVIMFFISYIPFGMLVLIEGHDSFLTTYQQTVLAIFFVVLANIISPLIFAYRNKRVRRGIQRLVSVLPKKAAMTDSKRGRKSDDAHAALTTTNNNGGTKNLNAIKELSDGRNHQQHFGNSSPRMIKLTRHTSVDVAGLPSFPLRANALLAAQNGRKLVIFNGRNGQITKVCCPHKQSSHHMKSCNKDKLPGHKSSCCWARSSDNIQGSSLSGAHAFKATCAVKEVVDENGRVLGRQQQQQASSLRRETTNERTAEPLLNRIRSIVPRVNFGYSSSAVTTKPINV